MKIIIGIAVAIILLIGVFMIGKGFTSSPTSLSDNNNVQISDGKQVIAITAKGGYSPKVTTAKADLPTVLKVSTNGTFDCSSGLNIPSLNYHKNLPPSGITEVEVPPQKAGTKLAGVCVMGMYNFAVNFN